MVRLIGTIMVAIWLSACGENAQMSAPEGALVLHNVSVLSMESEDLKEAQSVVILEDQISWVGPATELSVPDNATVVEGDLVVMPGLAEMHGHIPGSNQSQSYREDILSMYVLQGVTTLRGMAGDPIHLELREQAREGEIISPRIFAAGPPFSGNSVPTPEAARQRVAEQAAAGYDLLKFSPGLNLDTFNAAVEEAKRHQMPFAGHISYDVGLERSLDAGKSTIDHLDRYMEFLAPEQADREDPPVIYFGYDLTPYVQSERIEEAAQRTAEDGVGNVPTNTLLENVLNPSLSVDQMEQWPGVDLMPASTVEAWGNSVRDIRANEIYDPDQAAAYLDIRKQLTRALYDAGSDLLLLGADAPQIFNPPGYSVHRELEIMVDAGLSPFDALRTGTVNVATHFGEQSLSGKVAPGYRPDLLVLSVNPLEILPFGGSIEGVVLNGRYLDRDALEELEEGIRTRMRNR
ncbi:MAG: amidohydrolase family protein [Bacteroidota bacterium]